MVGGIVPKQQFFARIPFLASLPRKRHSCLKLYDVSFKGESHMEDWFRDPNEDDCAYFGVTESGYSNIELGVEWLQKFDTYLSNRPAVTAIPFNIDF